MFDCIWTYSDYRRVNRIEKPNNGKSKIQGSAEVLVAKKVKNITKPTITFPRHISFVQSVQTFFYSADSIIYTVYIYIFLHLTQKQYLWALSYPIFAYSSQFSSQCASFLFLFFDPSY